MSAAQTERDYLGLGSNLDGPEGQLFCALRLLGGVPGIRVTHISSFYRTAPWGNLDQPDFVNAVVALECALAPEDLLQRVLAIERRMGRVRDASRWTPRTIDLDLLYFGDRSLVTDRLTVPHPHVAERAFVLVPLIEIAANLADSGLLAWQRILSKLPHDDVVRLLPPVSA